MEPMFEFPKIRHHCLNFHDATSNLKHPEAKWARKSSATFVPTHFNFIKK